MRKSRLAMRRAILLHLYGYLKAHYSLEMLEDISKIESISDSEIDAILSFKSDFELDELRSALTRLKSGSYGYCIGCKRPLRQSLLDVDPTRRVCPSCETEFNHKLQENLMSSSLASETRSGEWIL